MTYKFFFYTLAFHWSFFLKSILLFLSICNLLNCECNVHIYGLARSGTNFLEMFLKDNFSLKIDCRPKKGIDPKHKQLPGYKHFRIFDDKSLITAKEVTNNIVVSSIDDLDLLLNNPEHTNKYIVIYKNIYSWLYSYLPFAKIIRRNPDTNACIKEYVAYRKKWNELQNDRVLIVNYNSLVMHPIDEDNPAIQEIIAFLDIEPVHNNIVHRRIVPCSSEFSNQKEQFYREKIYLQNYTIEVKEEYKKILQDAGIPYEE